MASRADSQIRHLASLGELDGARRLHTRLAGAKLSGADLRDACLGPLLIAADRLLACDLSGAQLKATDLSRADLRQARLIGADLSRANASGAQLRGADLTGARRQGSRGLDEAI